MKFIPKSNIPAKILRPVAVIVLLLVVGLYLRTITASADSSLIAAYNFNELNGDTVVDQSGYGNTAVVSGGVNHVPDGKFGGALQFNGSNGIATIADSNTLDLTNAMTLEAWVNPTTTSGWRTTIIKEQPNNLVYALYAGTDTNTPSGEIGLDNLNADTRGNSPLPTNTWTHIAVTYNGSTLKFYKNGVLESEKNLSGNIKTSGNPLRIGGNNVWGEYFSGRIDDVRIYNRVLTETEIQVDKETQIPNSSVITPTITTSPTPTSVSTPTPTSTSTDPRTTTGEWSNSINWPIVAVHTTLLPNGKVLLWDGWEVQSNTRIWDRCNS